jgi:hypothetical protein
MGRPVVHWELWSPEPGRLAAFYEKAFGWTVRLLPDTDYRLVETGGNGGINGGIMKPKQGPWPGNMAFYIDVDDLDAYGKRIVEAGGRIIVARQEVAGVGSFALFADPDNRVLGMWQQNKTSSP